MKLKKILLIGFVISMAAVHPSPSSLPDTPSEWLIFYCTKNYSYAMTRVLLKEGHHCTLVVKPDDLMHADQRFKPTDNISIVTVDYTNVQERPKLFAAAEGKRFLFVDPEHQDYLKWHSTIPAITANALITARKHNLTVFYPGRVYPFSNAKVVTEKSAYQPATEQGKTLTKVEKMMRHLASKKLCKIHVVRASYAFGPGMYDFLLSSSFKDIPRNGQLTWLFRTDQKFQFSYTHDVARLMLELSKKPMTEYFSCTNYAGYTLPSVTALGESIVDVAKKHLSYVRSEMSLRQRVIGNLHLNLASKVEPNALRGKDLAAFFSQPVMLDDSALKQRMSFTPTPLKQAIAETLEWYATNPDTKGLCIL